MSALQNAPAKDTDGNYLAVCQARETVENGLRLDAVGNFISIAVLNTQRTACLVGLVGTLVLGMPAVGSGQGTVADDRAALEALYDATNGANWSSNDNWKTDEPLGQWFGVRINNSDGRVTRLDLSYNELNGTIPAEIGNLTSLTELELSFNLLSGTIPAEIGNLTSLTELELYSNQLSGTIPAEIGNLTSLTELELYSNLLSGTIPAEIGYLTSLTWLALAANQLSGTIPVELGNLTRLEDLFLGGNQLSGTIPAEIGYLTSLTWLALAANQLSGTIPAELGKLTSLSFLSVDTDTGLCLAPDFDLTSPFATRSGLPVCSTEPSGTPTPKDPPVVQMAVDDAIAAATNGEGLRTGGAPVTVRFDALFTFPSSAASAVTYAGTTFSVSSTAPGVVSVSTTDAGPGVVLTPGPDAGTAAVTVDARPEGQPAATPVASVMFEVEVNTDDTTAPTVTITSAASEPVSGPFPITVTFSEPVTGFELPDLVVGNGSASELQGTEASYTATVTPTASGAVTVDIAAGAAEDGAGNPSAAADQLSITADLTPVDTTAPTVTITSAASEPVSGPFPITVTFSEPVTGFELPDLVVGNGSASELQGTEASYTATVTPIASGAVTVDIAAGAAEDSAGNPSAAADQLSITADLTPVDTTAPTVTITSAASEPVSGPFPITVTFSEPVTGFELPDLVVGNGSASELQGTEASYTATVTPTASGAVTVDIAAGAAEDGAGNPSAAADQLSITADLTPVDTTAPTVTITSAASEPVSGPFPITVTFSEPVTGFELPDLVVGNGSASELQGTEASYTATVTPTASGAVTVDIAAGAAEDGAGNPSAAADQLSITADLTPVPALPLAGAVALAALLLVGGIRRRRGVLTT